MKTNIIICGLGGQGVIFTSNIFTSILLSCTNYNIKTSEIHGISQRGGSVYAEIRFGDNIYSPTISAKSTNYLLDLDGNEYLNYISKLSDSCVIVRSSNKINSKIDFTYEFNEINVDHFLNSFNLDVKSANMVLLSSLLNHLELDYSAIKNVFKSYDSIELSNLKALGVMLKI